MMRHACVNVYIGYKAFKLEHIEFIHVRRAPKKEIDFYIDSENGDENLTFDSDFSPFIRC